MAYMKDSTGRRLDSFEVVGGTKTATPPVGLGWPSAYALTATLTDLIPGSPRSMGTINLDISALFNTKTTALSAPGATFYVANSGLDTNDGLTSGTAFKSIWKAVVAANTANVPTKVIVASGTYFRTNNPWYNGGTGVTPNVDIAYVASGGRVITGTFDPPGTPTRDATYVNCYSWTVSSVNRVCDMRNLNRFGNYTELTTVTTAALCNSTPDSSTLTVEISRQYPTLTLGCIERERHV
jgi:hypothetical protein